MENIRKSSIAVVVYLALIETHQYLVLELVIIGTILPQILLYVDLSGQLTGWIHWLLRTEIQNIAHIFPLRFVALTLKNIDFNFKEK